MIVHPGEFLMEKVLIPSGISIQSAAGRLGVSSSSLASVITGKQPITVALAHALSLEFSYSRQWWLDLQRAWDEEQRLVA